MSSCQIQFEYRFAGASPQALEPTFLAFGKFLYVVSGNPSEIMAIQFFIKSNASRPRKWYICQEFNLSVIYFQK